MSYGLATSDPMGLLASLDRRLTNLENMITSPTAAPDSVVIGSPPNTSFPPISLSWGVTAPTDVVVSPGALYNNVYCDISWQAPSDGSASSFEISWAVDNGDGTYSNGSAARVGGNTYRINNLLPNTKYVASVSAVNVLGQIARYPTALNTYLNFTSTSDSTVPPAVTGVVLGQGATSVIVKFNPLTLLQAPDVASGGLYQIDISTDPAFATVFRSVRTSAFVVAFNDVYPNTTLQTALTAAAGAGTALSFQDLSGFPQGAAFSVLIDQEYINLNIRTGNNATVFQRNVGANAPAAGPVAHAVGAVVTAQTQTTWYARVAAIDASGNQGAWTVSGAPLAGGGVLDSMIVGDISAARITFGTMKGDRIETNTLNANTITSGSLTAANITLAGGSFIAGNPPATGLIINSQGLRLYSNGALQIALDAGSGVANFYGSLNGNTITGASITGSTLTASDGTNSVIVAPGPVGTGIYFRNQYGYGYDGYIIGTGSTFGVLTIASPISPTYNFPAVVEMFSGDNISYGPQAQWGNPGHGFLAVSVYAGTFSTFSSETLKRDIQDHDIDLDKLNHLQIRKFQWRHDTSDNWHYGLVAEEAEEHLPELISRTNDGLAGVNLGHLVSFLIAGHQEQMKRIADLEGKLARKGNN